MIQKIINPFINDMRHFKNFWNQFWFGPVNLKGVSLFRFVFGIGVFFYYSITFLEYDIFFSDQGLIPYVHYYDIIPDFFLSPIPWHILTKKLLIGKILYVCYLFGLLSVAFGWLNRSIYWIVFILHLAFLKRNPFVIYGADLVGTCWLFYLCFVQANLYYRLPPIWKWFEQKSFSKYWNGAHSKTKKPQSD